MSGAKPQDKGTSHEQASEDAARQADSTARLASTPSLQLAAELLHRLRAAMLPWWTPAHLRQRFSASARMRWLEGRPDLRQQITSALTGLAPNAARKKTAEFQAELIDSVLEAGDTTVEAFEAAFPPEALVVHGPADALFREFRAQMPWGESTPPHQELVAWLIEALLRDRTTLYLAKPGLAKPGLAQPGLAQPGLANPGAAGAEDAHSQSRVPILTSWELRTAIDGKVWHTQMPLEVRVAIDDARLQLERSKPTEPFHAQHDLAIAMASTIATSVPLVDLVGVILLAEKTMGFSPAPTIHVPEGADANTIAPTGDAAREASTEPFASASSPPPSPHGTDAGAEATAGAGDSTPHVDMPPGSKKKRTTLMEFPTKLEAAEAAAAQQIAASFGGSALETGTLPAAAVTSSRNGHADARKDEPASRSDRPRSGGAK